MSEVTYYSDSAVKVTSQWVRLGGKSYRLQDLASVKMWSTQSEPVREAPTFLVILGSILMFGLVNLQALAPGEWVELAPLGMLAGMLLALAGLVVLGLQMLLKGEYVYIVQLSGSFGTSCPFATDDEAYVRKLVASIRVAMHERGSVAQPAARLRDQGLGIGDQGA